MVFICICDVEFAGSNIDWTTASPDRFVIILSVSEGKHWYILEIIHNLFQV
jgi:hypothetical protein